MTPRAELLAVLLFGLTACDPIEWTCHDVSARLVAAEANLAIAQEHNNKVLEVEALRNIAWYKAKIAEKCHGKG